MTAVTCMGLRSRIKRHVELVADAREADGIAQLAVGLDDLAVDAGDDVARLDAGLLRRRTFVTCDTSTPWVLGMFSDLAMSGVSE